MNILVSKCLLGECCSFDGLSRENDLIKKLCLNNKVIPVCPEMLGGFSSPRERHEISGGDGEDVLAGKAKVMSESGKEQTMRFIDGAKITLRIALENKVEAAVLKAKSPSCGVHHIHSGDFKGKIIDGVGVAAALLKKNGITKLYTEKNPPVFLFN